MFLMDRFFNGAFLTFGLEVIAFAERDQVSKNLMEKPASMNPSLPSRPLYIKLFIY